jgi:hypothetical protein
VSTKKVIAFQMPPLILLALQKSPLLIEIAHEKSAMQLINRQVLVSTPLKSRTHTNLQSVAILHGR